MNWKRFLWLISILIRHTGIESNLNDTEIFINLFISDSHHSTAVVKFCLLSVDGFVIAANTGNGKVTVTVKVLKPKNVLTELKWHLFFGQVYFYLFNSISIDIFLCNF